MITRNVTPEMEARTNAKFAAWDKVVELNLLESEDEELRSAAVMLLRDPTIYLYAFFKDFRDSSLPLKLYPYQDEAINDCARKVLFVAANQIGKSITDVGKALTFALTRPGTTTLMTSKTLPQSKDLLRQIKNLLYSCTLNYEADIGDTETKTEIYFKHYKMSKVYDEKLHEFVDKREELPQSRIICVPRTEAALGYAVDLLIPDELFFYEDGEYFYQQVLEPRTFATKGQIFVTSNPNGQQGIGWKLWNDPTFSKHRFNYLDKPGNTEEEFENLRKTRSKEVFDSTCAAIFTDAAGAFLSVEERKRIQHDRPNALPTILTHQFYVFFDWAKSKDRTVRIIGTPIEVSGVVKVLILEMKEYPLETGYDLIVDDLIDLIKQVGREKVFMVGWDNTGVGRGIEDFIKRVQEFGVMITPVEFSLENKSNIYTSFKFLVEQDRIDIPLVEECDRQLAQLRFQKTSRGYLQVHHESESDRDDYPDAIAGLCSLIIQPDSPPVTVTMITSGESVNESEEGVVEKKFLSTEERRAILWGEASERTEL